jgi:hypothetical protein
MGGLNDFIARNGTWESISPVKYENNNHKFI